MWLLKDWQIYKPKTICAKKRRWFFFLIEKMALFYCHFYNLAYLHARILHVWPVGIHFAHRQSSLLSYSAIWNQWNTASFMLKQGLGNERFDNSLLYGRISCTF